MWECRQLVHERDSPLAVCPQHCPLPSPEGVRLHTLSYPMSTTDRASESESASVPQYCPVPLPEEVCPKCTWATSMSTSEVSSPLKWSAQRPKTCKKLRLLQYARRIPTMATFSRHTCLPIIIGRTVDQNDTLVLLSPNLDRFFSRAFTMDARSFGFRRPTYCWKVSDPIIIFAHPVSTIPFPEHEFSIVSNSPQTGLRSILSFFCLLQQRTTLFTASANPFQHGVMSKKH